MGQPMFVGAALQVTVPGAKRNDIVPALMEMREEAGHPHPEGLIVASRMFGASGAGITGLRGLRKSKERMSFGLNF